MGRGHMIALLVMGGALARHSDAAGPADGAQGATVARPPTQASPGNAVSRVRVLECGVAIEAPVSLRATSNTKQEFEHMRLSRGDGTTVSISCLHKRETMPQRLQDLAEGVLEPMLANTPRLPRRIDAKPIEQALGRPVLLLELPPESETGSRSVLAFIESVNVFYWTQYTAPAASWARQAGERDRLLRSFRITSPLADLGKASWWHPPLRLAPFTLIEARKRFRTKVPPGRPAKGFDGKPAPVPPPTVFKPLDVKGPVGRLAAYITPDPGDGKRHPAVVWAHGGFGGIDDWFWKPADRSNDQSARAFREAGIVLAIGSWRAENDNPGNYELYYGEVDDFLAVADRVRTVPYVDPDRIYLAGHSSGGALVLLAAEQTDRFRAAFSLGGVVLLNDPETYDRYGGVPFDLKNPIEQLLRSAAPFVLSIRKPTYYFEGRQNTAGGIALWMAEEARKRSVPFHAFLALQADHFSLVAPLTELIARKVLADTGPTTNITFRDEEIAGLRATE